MTKDVREGINHALMIKRSSRSKKPRTVTDFKRYNTGIMTMSMALVPKKATGITMLSEIEIYCSIQSATLVTLITEANVASK